MVSFIDIVTDGDILNETDRYIQYHTLNKRIQYDSNKIVYKVMPDLNTFKKDEQMLKTLHEQHKQPFLKFVFPENHSIDSELERYLKENGYEYSWIELYINVDKDFVSKDNDNIDVVTTNEDNLVDFLNVSYEYDKKYGTDYAELKIEVSKNQLYEDNPVQVLSYYQGKPVGTLLIWNHEKYVELDSFAVREPYRKLGIGSKMQAFVADFAQDKLIILVADGEDTAKDMYKKQGYVYSGYQYEALKEYE
ncbi:GNAT family N-acetyltransferase [Mammaliicoccus vitulinus]|uniref:GNAT family N-acetyltransferase n=1 Tax=Mammaliicoccus vitulinus TaxID=71237 RepID=UPI00248CC1BB|nr:GNAT family N-acetyltransferase [Mammaliicoccus vitulinus]